MTGIDNQAATGAASPTSATEPAVLPAAPIKSPMFRARLRGQVVLNPQKGATASYTGSLDSDDGTVIPLAYIKDLTPLQLFNEAVAACIGTLLSLPMARACWVIADPGQGPWQHAPVIGPNGERLLFATDAIVSPSTLGHYIAQLGDAGRRRLADWDHLPSAVALDEWIANIDRHDQNLLVSGDGRFWLIDHSHVLTGDGWPNLVGGAATAFANQLPQHVAPVLDAPGKSARRVMAQASAAAHVAIDVSGLIGTDPIADLLATAEKALAISFLVDRRNHTVNLLNNRF